MPAAAWHTQRDEWVALGCEVGVLCGILGKIARDLSLMAQGEVGELAEPSGAGRGGSSAMPHKRNPVAAMIALAAALRAPQRVAALLAAMPQEHERGLGNWQAELAEWAGLFISAHGALKALAEAAAGLQVDAARMREQHRSHCTAWCSPKRVARSWPRTSARRARTRCSSRAGRSAAVRRAAATCATSRWPRSPPTRRSPARSTRDDVDAPVRCRRARRWRAARCAARRQLAALRIDAVAVRRLQGDRMNASDDFDRGLRNRRAVLGDDWVDRVARERERASTPSSRR